MQKTYRISEIVIIYLYTENQILNA